jgi:hypothetical protein
VIDTVSIDRQVVAKQRAYFIFALVGPNNDAHIEDLIASAKLCGVTYSEGCADKANFHCRKHLSRFTAICRLLS